MKADPTQQLLLLDLQAIDNHIRVNAQAQKNLTNMDTRKKLESDLVSFGPAFIAANGLLEDTLAEIKRIEDDVKLVNSRLSQDIERRDHSSSGKDIAGFEHEITTLNTRKEQLFDAELVLMQRLEDAEASLARINKTRSELAAQIEQHDESIAVQLSRLEAESQSLHMERGVLVAKLAQDLVELYDKQLERYGIGAAALTHGVSGGSGVSMTAIDLDKIRHASEDDVILCPDSSCILVRTRESGL